MSKFKFRAWYKPHLDKGIVEKFEQVEIDHELYFVSSKDKDIKYKFAVPFMDDDWLVEQETGLYDKDNQEIYEGDIVKVKNLFDEDGDDYDVVGWIEIYKDMFVVMNEYEYFLLSNFPQKLITRIGNIHEGERK